MSDSKFIGLDGMRGIAALFVFLRHTNDYWGFTYFYHSYLAVDVFFILSGFVIAHAYEKRFDSKTMTVSSFTITRLIRLYPMYLLGLLVGVGLVIAKLIIGHPSSISTHENILHIVLLSLLFLPSNVGAGQTLFPLNLPSWSLFYELSSNFFYAAFRKQLNTRNQLIFLGFLFTILIYVSYKISGLDIGPMAGPKSIFGSAIRAFFGVYCGLSLYKLYLKKVYVPKFLQGQFTPVLLMGIVFVMPNAGTLNWIFDLIAASIIFPLSVLLGANLVTNQALIKPYEFLGEISFPLYILHDPIKYFFLLFFSSTIMQYQPLAGILLLSFTIIISLLAIRYIDEPVRKYLRAHLLTNSFTKNKITNQNQTTE